MASPKRLAGMKKLNGRANFQPRNGTHEQALEYVNKLETRVEGPWTQGTPPEQGKRNDLTLALLDVKAGCSELELAEKYGGTWCRNYRSFREYSLLIKPDRTQKTIITVLYGETGTGKSRYCSENYPGAYWKSQNLWWDNYNGEDVILDEFYGWLPYSFLLRLFDRNPLLVERKGGSIKFTSRRILCTSNKDPETWYPNQDYSPLRRRLENVIYIDLQGNSHSKCGSLEFPFNGTISPSYETSKGVLRTSSMPRESSRIDSGTDSLGSSPSLPGTPPLPDAESVDFGSRSRLITGDTYFPNLRVPLLLKPSPLSRSPVPDSDDHERRKLFISKLV